MPNSPLYEIEIRDRGAPPKLTGGTVIDGFPGMGLASTISSACIVSSLKLSLISELWSDLFPPLATISQGRLEAPARIYADAKRNLAIFLATFTPEARAAHAIARTMVRWAKERECSLIVTSVGLPLGEEEEEHAFMAVANGAKAASRLRTAGIPLANMAAIGGLAGSLLLEGRDAEMPVIALMIKTHEGMQDFEAGLKLAELLAQIVPAAQCETEGLREEALRTEQVLKRLRKQATPAGIYR